MNKTKFKLTTTEKEFEGKRYVTYGISASNIKDGIRIKEDILDISSNKSFVEKLIDDFTTFDLRIEHFHDTVYDFIYDEFWE